MSNPAPMNQNPNTNKECDNCTFKPGGVCEVDKNGKCVDCGRIINMPEYTPSPKDWEARFNEKFPEISAITSTPYSLYHNCSVEIKDFIRQEKAKSYEEAQKELAKEIIELQEDQPGEYGHGYDYAFQEIHTLLSSKHLLD